MSSALSVDLRERVVHAVETGASRHKAAERFGVSLAITSRRCGQLARTGRGSVHLHRVRWGMPQWTNGDLHEAHDPRCTATLVARNLEHHGNWLRACTGSTS